MVHPVSTGAVTFLGIWLLSQLALAVRMPRKELLGSSFDYYIVSVFNLFLQGLGPYDSIASMTQLAHSVPTGLLRTLGLSISTPRKRVAWVFNSFEYLM